MWTQAHREDHKQSGPGLPSDLTDAQWARLGPLIPAAKPGGGGERIWEELHVALREALHRDASPTAAIIDSQSLKAAEKGELRAGMKRTLWVTTPARR